MLPIEIWERDLRLYRPLVFSDEDECQDLGTRIKLANRDKQEKYAAYCKQFEEKEKVFAAQVASPAVAAAGIKLVTLDNLHARLNGGRKPADNPPVTLPPDQVTLPVTLPKQEVTLPSHVTKLRKQRIWDAKNQDRVRETNRLRMQRYRDKQKAK